MTEITDKQKNDSIGIDVVISVLESGHSVELPATGYSMYPSLKPGDRVLVNPLPKGVLPVIGSVIVCMEEVDPHTSCLMPHALLVMHRLLEIKKDDSGKILLITRGDSMSETDLPWSQDQIVGTVESYTRNRRRYFIKKRIPPEMEYKINRWILWIRNKSVASSR